MNGHERARTIQELECKLVQDILTVAISYSESLSVGRVTNVIDRATRLIRTQQIQFEKKSGRVDRDWSIDLPHGPIYF